MIFRRKQTSAEKVRDTDADWAIIGATEPYFGVLTHAQFKRDAMDHAAFDEFFSSGRSDVAHWLSQLRTLGPFTPKSAFDYGCGVGRLTVALADHVDDAIGFDISAGMLAEARRCERPGLTFTDRLPNRDFDLVVSHMVLQHVPPTRGYDLLKQIVDRVSPTGGIMAQIIFARTAEHRRTVGARTIIVDGMPQNIAKPRTSKRVPRGTMIVYDYDMSSVISILNAGGIRQIFLEYCDHGGMIGAMIYGLKA